MVSWEDATAFCGRLSEWSREQEAGRTYRLPTEAEWEYACRGGVLFRHRSAPFYFTEPTFTLVAALANFDAEHPYCGKKGRSVGRPTPVGFYPANPLGLFDMHGNIWEWCADWWEEDYYGRSERRDPQGPADGMVRVLRGGSWSADGESCRAASRYCNWPNYSGSSSFGFRVVLNAVAGLVLS
jgi:formylglycine-generating enzyme required for sulfatase activity